MKKYHLLIMLLISIGQLGCKKETVDPLIGNWKVMAIYSKYTDPIYGLTEKTIDIDEWTKDRGFFPGGYTHIRFYDKDSVTFRTAEPYEVRGDDFLYHDPDDDKNIKMTNYYKGMYQVNGNMLSFRMGNVTGALSEFVYTYSFSGTSLELTVKDRDEWVDLWGDLKKRQVVDKEVWFLEKIE